MSGGGVACASCGHAYTEHREDGGHCEHVIGDGVVDVARQLPCPCLSFRWVDPAGGSGLYGGQPEQSWPGP